MNVKFHRNCDNTDKILKISSVRCSSVKFEIDFLGLPWVFFFFFWCYYKLFITSLVLKDERKNAISLNYSQWYKIFVHQKSKLLNVLVDSVLIFLSASFVTFMGPESHKKGHRTLSTRLTTCTLITSSNTHGMASACWLNSCCFFLSYLNWLIPLVKKTISQICTRK